MLGIYIYVVFICFCVLCKTVTSLSAIFFISITFCVLVGIIHERDMQAVDMKADIGPL